MVIIIMGVSGCGKTTIGQMLSDKLCLPFYDADNFHSTINIKKMNQGIPLTDLDRIPWLTNLSVQLSNWNTTGGAILACSALKESYRQILSTKTNQIIWIHLVGSFNLIHDRMEQRKTHYMPARLLQTQFDLLEPASYAHQVDISVAPEKIIDSIILKLGNHE